MKRLRRKGKFEKIKESREEVEGFDDWIRPTTLPPDVTVLVGGSGGEARVLTVKSNPLPLDGLKKAIQTNTK